MLLIITLEDNLVLKIKTKEIQKISKKAPEYQELFLFLIVLVCLVYFLFIDL